MTTAWENTPHAQDSNLRLLNNGSPLVIKPPQSSLQAAFANAYGPLRYGRLESNGAGNERLEKCGWRGSISDVLWF